MKLSFEEWGKLAQHARQLAYNMSYNADEAKLCPACDKAVHVLAIPYQSTDIIHFFVTCSSACEQPITKAEQAALSVAMDAENSAGWNQRLEEAVAEFLKKRKKS